MYHVRATHVGMVDFVNRTRIHINARAKRRIMVQNAKVKSSDDLLEFHNEY